MKNFGILSERTLDFLNGDVKSVTTKEFDIEDGLREYSDHSIMEYNSLGNRCLSLYYEENGRIRLRQVSIFDDHGNKIGYTNYDEDGLQDSNGKFELDYKGRIVSKYHNGVKEEIYEYDSGGKISVVSYPNTGSKVLYKYNEDGLATQQLSIRGGDSLFGNSFGGPNKKLTTFVNDRWGNIIEMKVYNAETNELLFSQKNTFNDRGDEIESVGYKSDGSVYSHVKYEYEYDNIANWISQKTMTKEGRIYREKERIIVYFKIH